MDDPLPALNLERGDRLEPSNACPDIGAGFDGLADGTFTITLVFWRRSAETSVRHRCPIMDVPGCSVHSLMIDTLHCLFLGVVPRFLEASIWLCISNNVWQVDATHAATRDELCIQCCRADLFTWYKRYRRDHPGKASNELQDQTPRMLGARGSWGFSPKGAEARWMLPFVNDMLERHKERLLAGVRDALIESGAALERMITMMNSLPVKPPREECKAIV